MLEFEKELSNIADMLCSNDYETRFLGYNLLRDSKFKQSMRGKLWSENNMSFYKFNLFALNDRIPQDHDSKCYVIYHNDNKIAFARKVVLLYLQQKLIIRELK
jgi:hypothetical protein